MGKRIGKRAVAGIGAAVVAAGALLTYWLLPKGAVERVELWTTPAVQDDGLLDYTQYREQTADVPQGARSLRLPLDGDGEDYVVIPAGERRDLTVEVPETAMYSLRAEYAAVGDTLLDYDITVLVNGSAPYAELRNMPLKSQWEIDGASFQEGFSPDLVKTDGRLTQDLRDRNAYYPQALQICLEQGTNTLTVQAGSLDIALYALVLFPQEETPTYDEYRQGLSGGTGESIYFQGEYPDYRNNPSILELSDGTSAETVPVSVDKKTMNTIGGTTYSSPQDTITWKFRVEKSGTYTLNLRVRQDFNSGAAVCRTLLLDGEVPFEECRSLTIPYRSGFWQYQPGDGDGPYQFELEAGEHTLTLEVALGENAAVIQEMNKVLDSLNTMYRRIIMLTSPNPDPYRDYLIEEKLPDVLEEMEKQAAILQNISDYIAYIGGGRGSDTSVLDKMQRQLEDFVDDPDGIPAQLSTFNSNKSAVGTWIIDKQSQPLEIDWLEWVPAGAQARDGQETLFQKISFTLRQFAASFTADYSTSMTQDAIEVWTTAGRDQVQVITKLIDEDFTAKTGISVQLKLVQAGTLLPAVVSGIGPDVSIMNANADAVNFASREAVEPLSQFADFPEMADQFYESALLPLRLEGEVYGLPEQQTFPVLFYRTDIFEELGLSVPETWDEAYNLMFELQKNNMEFGIPIGLNGFALYLYQNKGELYNEDGSACIIDNENGVRAFRQWSKYFTDFSMPMTYNFVNRFRSGEMPIGVADYTTYNTLVVFAPEIYDAWDIACVPGTVQEDGSIDRSVASSGTCALMFTLSDTDRKNQSWEFLKWWCGSGAQQEYAREIEIRLGSSARYPAANKIAFDNLMWTPRQLDVLKEQIAYVKGIPEVPGGYFTSRHVENSFRQVVLNDMDVKETLVEYCELINLEIAEKRDELHIGEGA